MATNIPQAQFSPIAPLAVMQRLDHARAFGDYHLLLAHIILEEQDDWKDFYRNRRVINNRPTFVIMDNSLIELGQALQPELILKAAGLVNANAIILPDRLLEAEFTAEASALAAAELGKPPTGAKYMGVVQGRTDEECLECARLLMRIPYVGYLALPRVLTNNGMSRVSLAQRLQSVVDLPIHLLGFSDNLRDDMSAAAMPGVMGIDSAMPIWYAAKGVLPRTVPARLEGKRPANFWSTPRANSIMVTNINTVKRWIKAHADLSYTSVRAASDASPELRYEAITRFKGDITAPRSGDK